MIDTLGRKGLQMIAFRCKEARKGERGDSEGNIGFGGVLSSGRGGVTNGKRGPEHVCAYHVFHMEMQLLALHCGVIGLMIIVVRFPN